jgi:exodeoxyribonuclease VII small subunit
MSQPSAKSSELSFEKALAELEKIVSRMESSELSLEQSLAAHKRGLELARFCQQRLEAAQQQVKVLEGDVLKPLEKISAAAGSDAGSDAGSEGDDESDRGGN